MLGESRIQNTAEQIDTVNGMLWQTFQSEKPFYACIWVDIKDVGKAHVRAIDCAAPTGTEFLLSRPGISWDGVAEFVKTKYPQLGCKLEPPFKPEGIVETTAAEKFLGLEWTPIETTLQEMIDQQLSFQGKSAN